MITVKTIKVVETTAGARLTVTFHDDTQCTLHHPTHAAACQAAAKIIRSGLMDDTSTQTKH